MASKLYLVHIRAIISLYQTNTVKCTHILVGRHFLKTVRKHKMFQPLKGHLQGVHVIHSSSNSTKRVTRCRYL